MSEEQKETVEETTEETTPTSAETSNTEHGPVPYERFKEVNDKLRQLREQLEELQTDEPEDDADDELEKANKAIKKHVDNLKEGVDDAVKALLDKLPLAEQLEWLSDNTERTTPMEGIPSTPNGEKPGQLSEEDKRRKAARTF